MQKYLAMCGVGSRRLCETLISDGRIQVNDAVVDTLGSRVTLEDHVTVDGRAVAPEQEKVTLLYYKPMGEITTSSDPLGRATVMDRFRDFRVRLYPIGRLDYDSEGLLLLTNDGALTERLLHPSHQVDKTYIAQVTGLLTDDALQTLRQGVQLDDGMTAPAQVRVIRQSENQCMLSVTIHEGRNRQVRRMCEAVGRPVMKLRRVRLGPIQLGDLKCGQWRVLTEAELEALHAL